MMAYVDYSSSATSMGTPEWNISNEYCKWTSSDIPTKRRIEIANNANEYIQRSIENEFYNCTAISYGGAYENNISKCYNNTTSVCDIEYGSATTGDFLEWGQWHAIGQIPKTPADRLRVMIQDRQAPMFIRTPSALSMRVSDKEKRARDTLRRLVGESQYRKFLSHGFITARGKSGKIYQIKTGHKMTNVYTPLGKPIETLCVVLRGQFPPTDELITRFLMILNDEESFRALANVLRYNEPSRNRTKSVDQRSLPAIFESLKKQAA